MALPNQFQTQSPVNPSVDYFDYISKTGYVNYYGIVYVDSVGTKYKLMNNVTSAYTSYRKSATINVANTSPATTSLDYDFDLDFTNPATIKGVLSVAFTISVVTGGGGQTGYFTPVVNVYHVNGSGTETSIGTSTGETFSYAGVTQYSFRKIVYVTCSNKKFSNGEKLRVNIKLNTYQSGGSANYIFYHNPDNDTGSGISFVDKDDTSIYNDTNVICTIPFKIGI